MARNDKDFISLENIKEIDGDMNDSYEDSELDYMTKKLESAISSSALYETSLSAILLYLEKIRNLNIMARENLLSRICKDL